MIIGLAVVIAISVAPNRILRELLYKVRAIRARGGELLATPLMQKGFFDPRRAWLTTIRGAQDCHCHNLAVLWQNWQSWQWPCGRLW
jgi:hypothetical protein